MNKYRGLAVLAGGIALGVGASIGAASLASTARPSAPAVRPEVAALHAGHLFDAHYVSITPHRVYDSRSTSPLFGGHTRTISVATGTDTVPNVVPAGATAITYTLTVVHTVSSGHLTVYPAGASAPLASTINWTASNQTIATGTNVAISAGRQITVAAASAGRTDFIVDVTGYFSPPIWVNFNGAGTILSASPHVVSVTRIGTGNYEVVVDRVVDDCVGIGSMNSSGNPDDAYVRPGGDGPTTIDVTVITPTNSVEDGAVGLIVSC